MTVAQSSNPRSLSASPANSDVRGAPEFATDVRESINAYFSREGIQPRANADMIVKTIIMLTVYVGSYGLILSGQLPLYAMWLLCFVMGVAMAGIGFSVCHDALHGAYLRSRRGNRLLGYI